MSNYEIRSGDHAVFTDPNVISQVRNSGVTLIDWKHLRRMTSQSSGH